MANNTADLNPTTAEKISEKHDLIQQKKQQTPYPFRIGVNKMEY